MTATEQQWGRSWHRPDIAFDVVALAASVGGRKALSCILAGLPTNFPASVLVQHLCRNQPSRLADILSRQTALRLRQAQEGDVLRPATVFIPVPDRHLLVQPSGTLSLSQASRVQFVRPSADLLFESAASAFGEGAVAFLTGTGQDGAKGVQAVRKRGGFVIAQDEATSERFDMPPTALATGKVDLVLPLYHIAFALRTLAGTLGGW